MKKLTLKETLLLFGGFGFMILWISEIVDGIPFAQNYFWGMMGLLCWAIFQYIKNERLKKN
jgi:hypothetical protein